MAVCGVKLSSMTGSKILTSLTASIGGAFILKDVKEEFVKNYFNLNEEERRVYHLNRKNEPKKRLYIFKKKVKQVYKTILTPIKNFATQIIDKKILHLKEEPKFGIEKLFLYSENNEIQCNKFRESEIKRYYKRRKKIVKINYKKIILKLKKKYEDKRRTSQSSPINQFFEVKKKIISKLLEIKEKELKEKYPDFEDPTIFDKAVNNLKKMKSYGIGIFKSLSDVVTFGYTSNYWSKNDMDNILEMIQNLKYNDFQKELKEIEKEKENFNFYIIRDDLKFLAESSEKDSKIFKLMNSNEKKEWQEIKEEIAYFGPNLLDEIELKEKKKIKKENKIIKKRIENHILLEIESVNDSFNLTESLLDNEENDNEEEFEINTKSH